MEPETHEQLEEVFVDPGTKLVSRPKDNIACTPILSNVRESEGFLARRHAALTSPLPSLFDRPMPVPVSV